MKLEEVILSTLEELEQSKETNTPEAPKTVPSLKKEEVVINPSNSDALNSKEALYLNNIKERIHVLFEGFQSPNNTNIEAKVDLTLNFLEYLLSTIETRLNEIKK